MCLSTTPLRHANPFMAKVEPGAFSVTPVSKQLQGLRLAVKDLYAIQGHTNSAGNPDWYASHLPAKATCPLVKQLLQAGAQLIGITHTDELAYSLMGNNFHYGSLINPAAPERLSGGSSNGSAVAVAADLADIGLGTDTGGSIRIPASFCGLYGFRPTHGLLEMQGVIGLAPPFDTPGWMTRDLKTLERVGQVLLPVCQAVKAPSYELWWPETLPVDRGHALLEHCQSLGLDIAWRPLSEQIQLQAAQAFRILQGRAADRLHGEWIQRVQPRFGPDIAARFAQAAQWGIDDELWAQQQVRKLNLLLNTERIVILPTTNGAAPMINMEEEQLDCFRYQLQGLTAYAGLFGRPQLTLPLLEDASAPWGLSLMGPRGTDALLLQQARMLLNSLTECCYD